MRHLRSARTDKGFRPMNPGVPTTAPARRRARGDSMRITRTRSAGTAPGRRDRRRPACWSAWRRAAAQTTAAAATAAPSTAGPDGHRRRHQAHAVDPRTAGEAGQAAGRGVQRAPQEPGRADRRPQRRLRRQGRRRRRLRRPARPVRRRHRLRAQLGAAGPVPGPHRRRSTRWRSRTRSTRATSPPAPPTARSTSCRSSWTCRCCSGTRTCSRRPGSTRRRRPPRCAEFADGRQGGPGAEQARRLRHRDRPATAAAAWSSPGSRRSGPTARRS